MTWAQIKADPAKLTKERKRCRDNKNAEYKKNPTKHAQRMRDWRRKNPDKSYRNPVKDLNRRLRKLYGIDLDQKREMLVQQNNACAICKQPIDERSGHVDHCHVDGRVRGILCTHCNKGLGCFRDSTITLGAAINYLSK